MRSLTADHEETEKILFDSFTQRTVERITAHIIRTPPSCATYSSPTNARGTEGRTPRTDPASAKPPRQVIHRVSCLAVTKEIHAKRWPERIQTSQSRYGEKRIDEGNPTARATKHPERRICRLDEQKRANCKSFLNELGSALDPTIKN